jgi:hypothetical protein
MDAQCTKNEEKNSAIKNVCTGGCAITSKAKIIGV